MDLPLIVMLACFLASFGGRAQNAIAALSNALERSSFLPNAAIATAALSTFAMAYAGANLSAHFIGLPRGLIVAAALALAAIDLLRSAEVVRPAEPTRSLGAIGLVLLAKQLFDAPRWLAFAGGAAILAPVPIGLGAWFGSSMALLIVWLMPELTNQTNAWSNLRKVLAVCCFIAAGIVTWIGASIGA